MAEADTKIPGGFVMDFKVETIFRVDNTLEFLIEFFLLLVQRPAAIFSPAR